MNFSQGKSITKDEKQVDKLSSSISVSGNSCSGVKHTLSK